MEWIKLTSRGILRGSLSQSTDVIQLVWIKLLCLMNETKFRNGRFEYANGKPYPLDFIAISCGVSQVILEGCLCEYEEDINPDNGEPRIKYDGDGTLVLVNWELYQRKAEKIVAKEIAIGKAKETKNRHDSATTALTRVVNRLNLEMRNQRYEVTAEGKILDKKTGEVRSIEGVE